METADLERLLPVMEDLVRRAGGAILEIYRRGDVAVREKDDRSPLTEADLASQAVIVAGLRRLVPELPVLSEEMKARPYAERRGWRRFWLVDPLDGTKEFVKRNGEFTVNVALIEDGEPILGVVYAPVLERAYLGARGIGAYRHDGAGEDSAERRPISAGGTGGEPLVVVASRSHPSPELEAFLGRLPSHELTAMGSSLKLCLVAEGAADFYPRLGPTMEWDTGAAHAVVAAAGGRVVDPGGRDLKYNKEDLRNPHFLVLGRRPVPWREAL